jgi:hypothetical protein
MRAVHLAEKECVMIYKLISSVNVRKHTDVFLVRLLVFDMQYVGRRKVEITGIPVELRFEVLDA